MLSSSRSDQPAIIDRTRIRRYFEAQAYKGLYLSDDEQCLFFFEELEVPGTTLHPSTITALKLKVAAPKVGAKADENSFVEAFNFGGAREISTANFLTKSASIVDYFPEKNQLLVMMDEANEEKYNLFLIDTLTGFQKQLTTMTQALMAQVSHDRNFVWFSSREPKGDGTFISTLCKVEIDTAVVTRIFNDEFDDYKLNFVAPIEYGPNRIFIFMDKGARRHELQMFDVNLKTGERTAVLEQSLAGHRNYAASEKPLGEEIFFMSMKSGFENLYALNIRTRDVRALTQATSKNSVGIRGLGQDCEPYIFQIFDQHPSRESELVLRDLAGCEFLRKTYTGVIRPHSHKSSLWLIRSTMTETPRLERVHDARQKPAASNLTADIPVVDFLKLNDGWKRTDFIQGRREVVAYKSFDGLEIPGFLFLPKGEVRGAIVIAFYGGEDYFSVAYQMYLEQGIAILSPAVRGSWGWGQAGENRLKGDLGGGEILDVIWGARFLAGALGLPENKVGVQGGSHGGYSVLRTLTLPKTFKGVDTNFNFGFGICWAGFADLIEFHQSSWISDWLVDLLGPLAQNESLYRERSPVHFITDLRAPLFISHGRNDRRVPLSTMTGFIDQLAGTPFDHKIWIQDGEGHKGGGRTKDMEALEQEFLFIENILTQNKVLPIARAWETPGFPLMPQSLGPVDQKS
jgi:hypothetical protein